jgi:hypothetical protein
LLYLLMGIPAVFSLLYVPSALIIPGDATATANNIQVSETLFRIGIVGELTFAAAFIFVVRALYRLLSGVNKAYASLMATLGLVSVPIWCLNVLNEIAALTLIRGPAFLSVFERSQLAALAMMFVELHRNGVAVAHTFSGLWLFPFGLLVIESRFIPAALGILLVVAGFGYLAISLGVLLSPPYVNVILRVATLMTAAEAPIILWLLIKGVREQSSITPAA